MTPCTCETYPMNEVIRANENHGGCWFDYLTKRFFRSRIPDIAYKGVGGIYFVTSEQQPPCYYTRTTYPRLYSVRQAMPDGSIETVGEFQGYATRAQAITVAKKLASGCVLTF